MFYKAFMGDGFVELVIKCYYMCNIDNIVIAPSISNSEKRGREKSKDSIYVHMYKLTLRISSL